MLKDIFEVFEGDLRDPAYAAQLLKMSLEEETLDVFLVNLRDIVRANGGVTALSNSLGLGQDSLYRALSPECSPEFKTICAILRGLGLTVDIAPIADRAA
jgi:probable addiction module antidote protein